MVIHCFMCKLKLNMQVTYIFMRRTCMLKVIKGQPVSKNNDSCIVNDNHWLLIVHVHRDFQHLVYPIVWDCILVYPIVWDCILVYPIVWDCILVYPIVWDCIWYIQLCETVFWYIQLCERLYLVYSTVWDCILVYPIVWDCMLSCFYWTAFLNPRNCFIISQSNFNQTVFIIHE